MKQNYEIHDKEMLPIICILEEWKHFLEKAVSPVEIWMDHKNLNYFMAVKKLNCYQAQWSLYLGRFDFLLHYRPERSMGKSDALFRQSDYGIRALDNQDMVLLYLEFFVVYTIKIFALESEKCNILRDIYCGNQSRR